MSPLKYVVSLIVLVLLTLIYELSYAGPKQPGTMPHDIRFMIYQNVDDMEKLVRKEINTKEKDDEKFLNQAAKVLAQTVLVHPGFTEREAGIGRLKSFMPQEDYADVVSRSADQLIRLVKSSQACDQATSLVALGNLVVEARNLKEEGKAVLKKIADSKIEVSQEAREYGREPLKNFISPSEQASIALGLKIVAQEDLD